MEPTRDDPAAREEAAGAPFRAWLPVGIVDAIAVVLALLSLVLLGD